MPIYSLKCKKCGYENELLSLQYLEELPPCTKCGGEVQKEFKSYSFVIKGYSEKNSYTGGKK